MSTHFQFTMQLTRESGESLAEHPIEPDWEPARAAVALRVLRTGADAAPLAAQIAIEPVWTARGEPHTAGARLVCGDVAEEFSLPYFSSLARELSADLVERKLLVAGDHFKYRLFAYRTEAPAQSDAPAFHVEEVAAPLDLAEADIAALDRDATPFDEANADDVPFYIPQSVLEEACEGAVNAGAVETGGILIGHLRRDAATRDLAVVVTAQVPAIAHGTAAKLSFTPETWHAVRTAIALRDRGEIMAGSWHSHPAATAWCVKCAVEKQRECHLQIPFVSEDDVVLHRTIFPAAHCGSLVVTLAHDGPRYALFGWRGGRVLQRGFSILGATRQPQPQPTTDHATLCPQAD